MQKNTWKKKRVSRFFITEPLTPCETISLPKHLVNYIVNVLRLKAGDAIVLFNGIPYGSHSDAKTNSLGEFSATLTEVGKRKVSAAIHDFIAKDIESPVKIHLFQGISRSERMDLTIQKAVELGADTITPVLTQRSNSGKWHSEQLDKKTQHWQTIAHNACEQSGRTKLVNINPAVQVEQMNDYAADLKLLLAPDGDTSLKDLKQLKPGRINIFIGPEGGLTDEEIELASNHQYQKIKLGPRVLRTETAGLAILSVLQFLWGDLS